jgi:hypothetical protein
MNVMMEGTMYPDGWHHNDDACKPDFTLYRRSEIYTRTQRPPKYYIIDFGISRRYDPAKGTPLEDPINGGDKTVPEHQGRRGIIPCNPFFTDIYYAGNVICTEFLEVGSVLVSHLGISPSSDFQKKNEFEFMEGLVKDMVRDDPTKRPTMDEVVTRFEAIRRDLSTRKLRARVSPRDELMIVAFFRAVGHVTRRIKYTLQGLPAIPSR